MKKKFVGFRLDEDLYEFVSQFARSKRMTVTQSLPRSIGVLVSLILEFYEKDGAPLARLHSFDTETSWQHVLLLRTCMDQ